MGNVLSSYKVGSSGLTGEIYIFKASEVDGRELVKRDAEAEVFAAVLDNIACSSGTKLVKSGDMYFEITCEAITQKQYEAASASKVEV